jgi:Pectate lyase superfamily protein
MSCQNPDCNCGCDPCRGPAPVNAAYEPLQSALDNFILNFYGTVTKTVVDGVVVWILPCDLATGIPGYPRDPALGTACYFKELFEIFDARITALEQIISGGLPGLGTMASQNANAVAITGGTISGVSITGLPVPSAPSDAATKQYADGISSGLTPQAGVVTASFTNINLASAPAVIDGRTMIAGERVLVGGQLAPAENGIYIFNGAGSAMTRPADADSPAELALNHYYFVQAGTLYAGTGWFIFIAPAVVGVDPLAFSQFSASSTYVNGFGILLTGNQFSIDTAVVMRRSQNLADVVSVPAARANLGLGDMALQNSGAVSITGGSISGINEMKVGYGIFAGPIAALNSATGALYLGYSGGASRIVSFFDNLGNPAPIAIFVGPTQVGTFTQLGFQGDVGMTTPGRLFVKDIQFQNLPDLRATKANAHIIINVKDYGAQGDGGGDDTAAINAAIAAMTNYSTLYFPAGAYAITLGALSGFVNLHHITVMGDGDSSTLFSNAAGAPGNFLAFASSCHHVTLRNLALVGAATARGSGIGVRFNASNSLISGIYVTGTSDHGFLIDNDVGGYTSGVIIEDCESDHTRGDGFHFGAVIDSGIYDCLATFTWDDGLGIGADGAGLPAPNRIEVANFKSIQAGNFASGGNHGTGVRIFQGAVDIHVVGGEAYQPCEAGLMVVRPFGGTDNCARIVVDGFKVAYPMQVPGSIGGIFISYADQVELHGCRVEASVSGAGFGFHDINDLIVSGCTAQSNFLRGFVTTDFPVPEVTRPVWNHWTFINNVSLGGPLAEIFYINPIAGISISNLALIGNYEDGCLAANYILTNRLAGVAKIMNNVSLGSKAIASGGVGIPPTYANNN